VTAKAPAGGKISESEAGFQKAVIDLAHLRGWMADDKRARASIAERFWAKVDQNGPVPSYCPELGPCWLWTASTNQKRGGYGRFRVSTTAETSAHRFALQESGTVIPPGMHVDHLCRVPRCVNPKHLEVVTPGENVRRGQAPTMVLHLRGVCAQGHCLIEHAARRRSTGTVVYCRVCRRESRRRKAAVRRRERRLCATCGQAFSGRRSDAKYCSPSCRYRRPR
jgi:hypothetical protein